MESGDTRPPGKAGSWYSGEPKELRGQLNAFLSDVPDQVEDKGLPVPGARVIIAPHAGYSYSGATAAWAYKALDLSRAKRVFILGPSHTFYLAGCAVSEYQNYGTPWGDLKVDEKVTARLLDELEIPAIPESNDNKEHSLEMHLPYLWIRLEQTFGSPENFPPIVPILIGENNEAEEKEVGKWLAEYFKDPENAFIVSSDFCHWGKHFHYMPYCPDGTLNSKQRLSEHDRTPNGPPIHETIKMLDDLAIEAIKTGKHRNFYDSIKQTKNTVCGRHPIGVTMAALEELGDHRFTFIQYNRSELISRPSDFSVSYASAYAVV
ncbi:memo-like protein [Colletotrichum orchidophilum]|uniref:Memo-like protein n=1 Tax=Colletotrichum orchidophilum TaxID=1209926 RepID=A0A1G4AR19_9PEZI|nr:memo-like protein [Colletotrichum orchidophilum]OHE91610.1 memo-like protein [Colletotrichum orchidophilum]